MHRPVPSGHRVSVGLLAAPVPPAIELPPGLPTVRRRACPGVGILRGDSLTGVPGGGLAPMYPPVEMGRPRRIRHRIATEAFASRRARRHLRAGRGELRPVPPAIMKGGCRGHGHRPGTLCRWNVRSRCDRRTSRGLRGCREGRCCSERCRGRHGDRHSAHEGFHNDLLLLESSNICALQHIRQQCTGRVPDIHLRSNTFAVLQGLGRANGAASVQRLEQVMIGRRNEPLAPIEPERPVIARGDLQPDALERRRAGVRHV